MIRGEPIDQRALSRAGRPRDASEISLAGVRKKLAQQFFRFLRMILDRGNCARDGAHIPGPDLAGPVTHGSGHCETNLCDWKVANESIRLADYLNSQDRSSQASDETKFVA